MSRATTFLLCMAALCAALPATAASGDSTKYKASLVSSCCAGELIESGATEPAFFVVRNDGTAVWGEAAGKRLSLEADVPRAPSEFAAADWMSSQRVLEVLGAPTPPGSTHQFAFHIKAPLVLVAKAMTPHFGLLIGETEWLDAGPKGDAKEPQGPDLSLPVTVVPAQPPSVALSLSSSSVAAGVSFRVAATAKAIAAVNRVVIQYGPTVVSDVVPRNPATAPDEQAQRSTGATFTAAGTGVQTVTATVYDDAGLSATATATVAVASAPPPPIVRRFEPKYFTPRNSSAPKGHFRVSRIRVLKVAPGSRVLFRCSRCSGRSRLGPTTAHHNYVEWSHLNTVISSRSRLTVYVTSPHADGRYWVTSLNASGGDEPPQLGCTPFGRATKIPCP